MSSSSEDALDDSIILQSEFRHSAAECRKNLAKLMAVETLPKQLERARRHGLTLAEYQLGRAGAVAYWRAHIAAVLRECPNA